ncbi:hypothetical protein HMPREF9062_1330 [Actinomyces sp. oral taxon 448 str. F0400]|nr:hypothetical protein HMPREF9062_1330 [Actinomyces sp. oral taxon 448 str. F0400]
MTMPDPVPRPEVGAVLLRGAGSSSPGTEERCGGSRGVMRGLVPIGRVRQC